jgi:hypothetical protein
MDYSAKALLEPALPVCLEDPQSPPRLALLLISDRLPDGWRYLAPHEDLPQYPPDRRHRRCYDTRAVWRSWKA